MEKCRRPKLWEALIPVVLLIVCLFCGITFLGASPHIPLLFVSIVTILMGMVMLKYSWDDLLEGILLSIKNAMPAILILMMVGIVISSWILSGIVPSMIYYGLKIISPNFFLISTLLICSIVSLCIGSSWTTAATVGIALAGIGTSIGIPLPIIVGAIISGSYFGDKMSPLSDTTNLAPAVAGTTLTEHIKHMALTTGPSYLISLILFGIINFKYTANSVNQEEILALSDGIQDNFTISPILLLAPVIVIVLVVLKVPAFLSLFCGALVGGVFAMIYQGADIGAIIETFHYGFFIESGSDSIDELLNRGGLDSMMWTVSMIIIAMMFAGALEKTQMINVITERLYRFTKSTGSLVLTTVLSAFGMNLLTGEQYLSIVVPGRMYKHLYEEKGLDMKNLSRVLEDAGTLSSPLIPWNGCGAFFIATFGIAPWVYVPFCFLNLINPLISVIYGFTGITMTKAKKAEGDGGKVESVSKGDEVKEA